MDDKVDITRRRFLTAATTVAGAVGASFVAVPFLSSWQPSERAQAAGAPVEVDLALLALGQMLTVSWRGKPVWVVHRSPEMLALLSEDDTHLRDPMSVYSEQPDYAQNPHRSIQPDYFVAIGLCTHLGCIPSYRPEQGGVSADWKGGFFCPCHGSSYDLAGRVHKNVPAPLNLPIPPHRYLSDTRLVIGEQEDTVT